MGNQGRVKVRPCLILLIIMLCAVSAPAMGKVKDDQRIAEVKAFNERANQLFGAGRYTESENCFKRALEILDKNFSPDDPHRAVTMNDLAELYRKTGRYAEAEALYKKALDINDKKLGRGHINFIKSLINLGRLYQFSGRYAEAEPLFSSAVEHREHIPGNVHPDVTTCMSEMAALYCQTGRYAKAESLYRKALATREQRLGHYHSDVATNLHDLAELYKDTGRYAQAEPLYQRALEIEDIIGANPITSTITQNSLAQVYYLTGRYAEAETLYKKVLKIREQMLAKDPTNIATIRNVAITVNDLALLYTLTGRYAQAEPLYKRALEMNEKALGKDHPDVAISLNTLAVHYSAVHRDEESHDLFARSTTIKDKKKELVFSLLSEKEKLAYISQNQFQLDRFLSHTAFRLPSDQVALTDTFNAWVQWKGSVLEAQGRYLDALMYAGDPAVRKKYQKLTELRREIARLELSKSDTKSSADSQQRLSELRKQKDRIEVELGTLSQEFKLASQAGKMDAQKLFALLPKDAAYLDFAKITVFDFQKRIWGKSNYLLFVLILNANNQIKLIDMGDTEEIDKHIHAYLQEMNRAKESKLPNRLTLDREARSLYDLIIKPIEPLLKGKGHLFISPDGNLNLIPFEVLSTTDKYLIEKFSISYVGAGRDMVKFAPADFKGGTALIMADPDYDLGRQDIEKAKREAGLRGSRLRGEVCADIRSMQFNRLPETKGEAEAIEGILKNVFKQKIQDYQDQRAVEDILYATASPKVLHLATHGYFLKAPSPPERDGRGLDTQSGFGTMKTLNIENPMLRSGIVLAGVNSALREGRDDGLVSAEKILGLSLRGTELVVLSACETGVGDVQNGEGVFGLKRAFTLSGAKSIVMSLWSVPSNETVELMKDFYLLIAKGKSKTEALREAKLNLIKKRPNPYYWGAFVLTGSP